MGQAPAPCESQYAHPWKGLTAAPSLCCGAELRMCRSSGAGLDHDPPLWVCTQDAGALGRCPGQPSTLQLGSEVEVRGASGGPLNWGPACNFLACVFLLQEGHPLWRSHTAGERWPAERLADPVSAAAGHDVFHPFPLAPGILPAALPTAGHQQTLMRVSA